MKLERYNIITPARETKRIVLNSLTSRFPDETCLYAMRGDFELKDLENGLARAEKFQSEQKKRSAPSHALALAHAGGGQTGTGCGARGQSRQGTRSGGRHDDGRGRNQQQGYPRQMHPGQQHQPPSAMPQQSPAWQQQQQQQQQPRFPQSQQQGPQHQQSNPWSSWERTLHHQQPNPWSSWGRPSSQQPQGRAPHQRRSQHRGGDQPRQQRAMCQQCGEEEHFPADCVITMPAPTPRHHPYAASSSGAYVAQYGTYPPPPWTSHDSDAHSTTSSYGATLPHDNYTPAPPMPRPPRSVGPTPPPPPAPPSDSDWSFSSGPSQALQAQYVPPGEFPSSDWNGRRTECGSVGGSYLPSAFVGQLVGIDQVNDVWIGNSDATTHMTRNADLIYDTRPPPPTGQGSSWVMVPLGRCNLLENSTWYFTAGPITRSPFTTYPLCLTWASTCSHFT